MTSTTPTNIPGTASVVLPPFISLRNAAAALDLDQVRLLRLAHVLHLAPGDPCLPSELIGAARSLGDPELRYRMVLDWLLNDLNSSQRKA